MQLMSRAVRRSTLFMCLALSCVIFGLRPVWSQATLQNLHDFNPPPTLSNASPDLPLRASDGCLYGTTYTGGTHDYGAAYRVRTDGTGTILTSFAGGYRGQNPLGNLVQASDGNTYGTTSGGAGYSGGSGTSGEVSCGFTPGMTRRKQQRSFRQTGSCWLAYVNEEIRNDE